MSENDAQQAPRRHGRRARQLTPEEAAERRALAAQHTGELPTTGEGPHSGGTDGTAATRGSGLDHEVPAATASGAPGDASAKTSGDTAHPAGSGSGAGVNGASGTTGALPAGRPSSRGAVAAPTADAPVPKLRKFGKRARIIEVEPEEQAPSDATGPGADAAGEDRAGEHGAGGGATDAERTSGSDGAGASTKTSTADGPGSGTGPDSSDAGTASASASAGVTSTPTIERDTDGVELGELGVGEAPGPKPAPRFDGKVLNRPEQGRGKPLLWIVWVLIALAIVALVVLLATGVLGAGSDQALVGQHAAAQHLDGLRAAAHAADPTASVPVPATTASVPTDLEVTSA